jgi:isopenicillin N synthase-like dioxygenase
MVAATADARRRGTAAGLPAVDLGQSESEVAQAIGRACRAYGFFYVTGHGIEEQLALRLQYLSRRFFGLPEAVKARYAMALGGSAWRGWFPLGGELTSGRPDWKEGLYLGTDLPTNDPRILANLPPHGGKILPGGRDRLSFPLFLDPSWDARIEPIRTPEIDDRAQRWDGANVHAFEGRYGDYVLAKVGKVFPQLREQVL